MPKVNPKNAAFWSIITIASGLAWFGIRESEKAPPVDPDLQKLGFLLAAEGVTGSVVRVNGEVELDQISNLDRNGGRVVYHNDSGKVFHSAGPNAGKTVDPSTDLERSTMKLLKNGTNKLHL